MDKQGLVDKIVQTLEQEIKVIEQAAHDAQEEARGNDSLSESQFDNRALEASRLAEAQLKRVKESQRRLEATRQMKLKDFTGGEPIGMSALVEVQHGKQTLRFFLAPQGAGTIIEYENQKIELITPQSPLGEALMDQSEGDLVLVETPKGELEYLISKVF